jgi:hypothetical protein
MKEHKRENYFHNENAVTTPLFPCPVLLSQHSQAMFFIDLFKILKAFHEKLLIVFANIRV